MAGARNGPVTAFTHARPQETDDALRHLIGQAAEAGTVVRLDAEETAKHPAIASGPGVELEASLDVDSSVAVALGGDGTVLRALRSFAGTAVPVFGVNFGEIGFLAAAGREEVPAALGRALHGDFETLAMPAMQVRGSGDELFAFNDLALTRRAGDRVAELGYSVSGEEIGRVRSDGIVVATPAGSTGYNLANGGPVMAWGVEGFVVSFIAPHSLTARALVVAPDDELKIQNRSVDPVELVIDGRPVAEIASGAEIQASFRPDMAVLAVPDESGFYRRLRETFGRLASS
ncbi:MAG: NAD(+)/NADH kinase [Solirubrobacteraceae bacterium]|nr:NAD(+)/NADH kinase [Solirubrobacteraceae bacterium]